MKEKKSISIRKLAALERSKALGLAVKRPAISALEHRAQEWKRPGGMGKCEVEDPKSREDDGSESPAFHEATAEATPWITGIGKDVASETTEKSESEKDKGFNWKPYKSEQGEVKSKPKNLNPASIAAIARKIMAREWAMALGRGGNVESEKDAIDRKLEQFRQKNAAERERKEIEEKRAGKQRKGLEEALRSFGRALLKTPKPVTSETAEALLDESLTEAGELINITWQQDGCYIFIEPWEEKRLRRKTGEILPAVFQAIVDDNLMLSSYKRVEDAELLRQTQNEIILRNILSSFKRSPQQDLHAFEDAVAEVGRIIRTTKSDDDWKIKVEPWEEMRKRNVELGGGPPVVTYILKADNDFEHITCAIGQ